MNENIALVTGGTGGIGSAICKELANRGATVIAAYNRKGNHEEAKAWQEEQDFPVTTWYVDVTDFGSCENMVTEIEKKYGKIDILVNNAGITGDSKLHKMTVEQWQSVLRTNLDSVFNVTRHVITGMIKRKYGRIINISSINGQKGQFGQANYAASKAGIHGFTKTLAQEVARDGITVNTVSPGYVATKMVMAVPENIREKIIAQIPVGRLGEPEEIAEIVSFLARAKSSFITGANIAINGGQYMQ